MSGKAEGSASEIKGEASMSRGLLYAMAVACGLAVANIYYSQPMLGIMEREMPGALTRLVPTATQLGFALGLFALVPLGDLVERRRLVVIQFLVLSAALIAAALAPTPPLLLIASFCLGVAATVVHQIVPYAAHLSSPEKRGATVGTVLSGVLCGILLSRTLAGFVASHEGWRAMFWLGVPLALGAGALMAATLPRSQPDTHHTYLSLVGSLRSLWRELPALRTAAITQALLFGGFTAFWSFLALHLQEPPFGEGPEVAGLFGIVGAVGIVAAPIAGRFADKRGPHLVILGGTLLALASWVIFATWSSIGGLVVGCILLDFAVQSVLVSNQHVVYALRPEARARLNTMFMGAMFLGGATGAGLATAAWGAAGWTAVCILSGFLALTAAGIQMAAARNRADSKGSLDGKGI